MRVALLVFLACGRGKDPEPVGELTLVTYNLNFGNPDVEKTMAALASTNADVALLQEVNAGWAALLKKRFEGSYRHLTFHPGAGGHAGHAVLSRFPFAADQVLTKPDGAFYPGHRLVITTPTGRLQILHVHLRASIHDDCFEGPCTQIEWVKGQFSTPPIRKREIETHWKAVDPALPTIVAGDFNEPADGDVVAFLTARGLTRVATTGPTSWHHVQNGSELLAETIDHVMIDHRITALEAKVVDAGASDHRPVIARLRLR